MGRRICNDAAFIDEAMNALARTVEYIEKRLDLALEAQQWPSRRIDRARASPAFWNIESAIFGGTRKYKNYVGKFAQIAPETGSELGECENGGQ